MFRFSMSTISRQGRSDSRSAVAAAAYRSGQAITDERTGQAWDYRPRQDDIAFRDIVLPTGVSEQWADRIYLWNQVEVHNKRKDSLLAREIQLALPAELPMEERIAMVQRFATEFAQKYSVAVDLNIHRPDRKGRGDERNSHAHLMPTANRFEDGKLGKKVRELDGPQGGREAVEFWRARWAEIENEAFARFGLDKRVDHRSYKRQGKDEIGVSLPYVAWQKEMAGEASLVGDLAVEKLMEGIIHAQSEIETGREPRANTGTTFGLGAASGLGAGAWEWSRWPGEWDPWGDLGEPDVALGQNLAGCDGEGLAAVRSELPGSPEPVGEVRQQGDVHKSGRDLPAVAATVWIEPAAELAYRAADDGMGAIATKPAGPRGPEGPGQWREDHGGEPGSGPGSRLANLPSSGPGDLEPVGGPGRELQTGNSAPVASPPVTGWGALPGKPGIVAGEFTGGGSGISPGPVPADPVPASHDLGTGVGVGKPSIAPGPAPVALPMMSTTLFGRKRQGYGPGSTLQWQDLSREVREVDAAERPRSRFAFWDRPPSLEAENWVRRAAGLRDCSRPSAPWSERQTDLLRDGEARALAQGKAFAEAQAREQSLAQVQAAIEARRKAQAKTRAQSRKAEVWFLQEQPQDAFGDEWALTHEPLGRGLPTPEVVASLAHDAKIPLTLGQVFSPWELPKAVAVKAEARREDDPEWMKAELKVREECKLPERDQTYYFRPWEARKSELVQDGWRKVLANLHQTLRETKEQIRQVPARLREAVERQVAAFEDRFQLPSAGTKDRTIDQLLRTLGQSIQERRQEFQEARRAERAAREPQGSLKTPQQLDQALQQPNLAPPPKSLSNKGRGRF